MGSLSILYLILLLIVIVPAFLPLIIKKPAGINRFGPGVAPADFGGAIQICLTKYADFNGRAGRGEYWWFYLFTVLVGFGIGMVSAITGISILAFASYAFTLPSIAAGVRRLHDINRSGWWMLLAFGFGAITLIIMWAQPSQKDDQAIAKAFE